VVALHGIEHIKPKKCRYFWSLCRLFIVCLLLFTSPLFAITSNEKQAKLTAAFIYQISKFVTWPESEFVSSQDELSICVLGKDHSLLMHQLTRFESKKSKGRSIQVHAFDTKANLLSEQGAAGGCQILFSLNGEWVHFTPTEISHLKRSSLLIGKSRNFLEEGGMMALIQAKSKINIFVNPDAMEGSQIKLESRLRALAKTFPQY